MSINPTSDLIHMRLSMVKNLESGTKPAVNVLSNTARKEQIAQIVDTFNKQNGTTLELPTKTIKEKAGELIEKGVKFLSKNKKTALIGAGIAAGVAAATFIGKKIVDSKTQNKN